MSEYLLNRIADAQVLPLNFRKPAEMGYIVGHLQGLAMAASAEISSLESQLSIVREERDQLLTEVTLLALRNTKLQVELAKWMPPNGLPYCD